MLWLALGAGCSSSRTEILVEVDSDLAVPGALDQLTIAAEGPDGRVQRSAAELGGGQLPLPRTLGMLHQDGPLGPFVVTVRGFLGDTEVVQRTGSLTFQRGRTLVWRVELLAECQGVACDAEQSCARGGCRAVEVLPGELVEFDGVPPPLDAGPFDACVPDETCNGLDDDCDGTTDEGFDLTSDPSNCGMCGVTCDRPNAVTSCNAGACVIDSCEGVFQDCDGVASTGCETDITTSAAHCGMCGNVCANPDRFCCAGTCARGC